MGTGRATDDGSSLRGLVGMGHAHERSGAKQHSPSPRPSGELPREKVTLYREDQRVSLRAFLRTFLQNKQNADSKAKQEFLTYQTQ